MRKRRYSLVRKILEGVNADELEYAMREYGIYPDSAQWTEVLSIWRGE